MIEFKQVVRVTPLNGSSPQPVTFSTDPFTFEPAQSDDDSGTSYRCDHDFVVEIPPSEVLERFSTPIPAIVELFATGGHTFAIGTAGIPAMVTVCPHLQRARLHVTCTMLRSPMRGA